MADLFLGLDLGTSGCKLIAFDGAGNEVARASRSYPLANPGPGLFELDADLVWSEAEACFGEINARALPGRVRTLSVSAQGEAILPVDRGGRALAPSPVSADMRGAGDADRLVERFGAERLYAITGQPASPLPSLPKLMWWRQEPPRPRRAHLEVPLLRRVRSPQARPSSGDRREHGGAHDGLRPRPPCLVPRAPRLCRHCCR